METKVFKEKTPSTSKSHALKRIRIWGSEYPIPPLFHNINFPFPEVKEKCKGSSLYVEFECRANLDLNPLLCDGLVRLSYANFNSPKHGPKLKEKALQMRAHPKSIIVAGGMGLHGSGSMNSTTIYERYFKPSLPYLSLDGKGGPLFFWVGTDPPGMLKPIKGIAFRQTYNSTISFNNDMCSLMKKHSFLCLNTNVLLHNVFSSDGTHRGRGANWIKAQILLNIIDNHLKGLSNW